MLKILKTALSRHVADRDGLIKELEGSSSALSLVVTTVFRMPRKRADLPVDYWKMQAKHARGRADLMRDPDAKATMLEIVQKYEAMADCAARREIIRHRPD